MAQFTKGMNYSVETGINFSGGEHTPLWLTANKQGLSSIEKNNGYLRAGIFRPLEDDKHFSYGFGIDLAGAYHFTSSFIVQQAYKNSVVDVVKATFDVAFNKPTRTVELPSQLF